MEVITRNNLILINELSSRSYSGNSLLSNATNEEKSSLIIIKKKLKKLAEYYSNKYNVPYGPFETAVSTGNDIAIGGTALKRIWSGMFKGAPNKQYAAQISFVMNPKEPCLDVGFYFGSASGHSKNKTDRVVLEEKLHELAVNLSNIIDNNSLFREKYHLLFDFGFKAYMNFNEVQSNDWKDKIKNRAKSSHIVARIYPNNFDVIENSTIDSYVAQIIFLMGGILDGSSLKETIIKPLSPEQLVKQAERNAEIGLKGELFVMKKEKEKLLALGVNDIMYPQHVALESMHYGYDVLSLDESGSEIYIEVKTTARLKEDIQSKKFFMTTNEYETYKKKAKSIDYIGFMILKIILSKILWI